MFAWLFSKESKEEKEKRLFVEKKERELKLFLKKYKNYLSLVAGEEKNQEVLPNYWYKLKNYEKARWLKDYLKRDLLEDFIKDKVNL